MPTNNEIGKEGEKYAAQYLVEQGYNIAAVNWRFSKAEIDIIAWSPEKILVFIEVKTRSYDFYGKPEESISTHKENLLLDAAQQYMMDIGYEWEMRFDVISILKKKGKEPILNHYKDVFFPSI